MKDDLYISGMNYTVNKFIHLSVLISVIGSIIFSAPIIWILSMIGTPWYYYIIGYAATQVLVFLLILHIPKFNSRQIGDHMNGTAAIIGRRLLIQLESGKSLINALIDIGTKQSGQKNPLSRLAYTLYMGKPLEEAINEAIQYSTSDTMKRLFMQIRNSLRTGSDLKHTLQVTLEEITREKIVEFETFGKKLNSMGMFYMIFGTIMPSLGVIVFVLGLALLGINISIIELMAFLVFILPVQLLFILIFSKMRPELEL
jgi:pilus assembly protein TadC